MRVALGADRGAVTRLVVGQGFRWTTIGLGLGLLLAVPMATTMRGFLFGVEPLDPATLVIVVAVLGGIAIGATWLPARRAARADPTVALRSGSTG